MRVVHDPQGEARDLATTVEVAEGIREQARGLMFRSELPDDYAMVFEFDEPPWWTIAALERYRSIHMLFVRVPLDVLWLRDGEVVQVKTLAPWRGFGAAQADTVIELPAGAAKGVEVGDEVVVAEDV